MEPSELPTPDTLDFFDAGDRVAASAAAGFDCEPFMNDTNAVPGHVVEDASSNSTSTLGHVAAGPACALTSVSSASNNLAKKQRLERKGHTKSRRGCYNCKRRRIKCQETYPSCGHCTKAGLNCEYPAVPQITHQPVCLSICFAWGGCLALVVCYPSSHSICLLCQHEYLMHAMLGLAASDLLGKDPSLLPFAMAHRVKAIRAIKKTLDDVPKSSDTFEEGNALMATCFALTFQSVLLEDGMAEFMTFCRGVVLVAIQMYCKGTSFLFTNWVGKDEMALLQPLMETVPPIRQDWVDAAIGSVRALEPLCVHPVETEYYVLLVEMVEALYTSPFRGYQLICKHYGWWLQIPHERFQCLIDPANPVCHLLATHWIAIKQIMAPVTEKEHLVKPREKAARDQHTDMGTIRWLKYLNRQLPLGYRVYNWWPVWVEEQLDRDLTCFGRSLG
ncbi:uncharacterized protein PG986_009141 [Apiospora aurea]|uniref:Zn(2)-C6 fungal-type domain-containing protein n=1 Tax=Apiospora aurea TaxID=335848 RepID=A0ABR1Q6S3_9PEZI